MTIPDTDSLLSYGGALLDYAPVIDPTTDRSAAGMNPALASVAGMTHTAIRAWVSMTTANTSVPTLTSHDATWGNAIGVAPTLARTGVGTFTVTWPATVQDEIPSGTPGYIAAHTLNLRAVVASARSLATPYFVQQAITSPNVATIAVFNAAGSLVDTTGLVLDVFAI